MTRVNLDDKHRFKFKFKCHPQCYRLLQGIILSFLATAAIWTGLTGSRGSLGRCIALLLAAIGVLFFAPRQAFRWPGVDLVSWELSIYFLLMLLILLLIARLHGLRLALPNRAAEWRQPL